MQFKLAIRILTYRRPARPQLKNLVEGLNNGDNFQTLLGVTGSGKTFTIANVIK